MYTREKIAECLVRGKELVISGGHYCLCKGGVPHRMKKTCIQSNIKLPNEKTQCE